jgi:hypothetical protein
VPAHRTDGYNSQAAPVTLPAASLFNKGATTEWEMQEAADRRREHSRHLSDHGGAAESHKSHPHERLRDHG